ncbi:MAG: hypothetical protein J5772_00255 [Clostridia bacterium]|nr:hypothetical protein [Clostridia bacterium]
MKYKNTAEAYYLQQLLIVAALGLVWILIGLAFLGPLSGSEGEGMPPALLIAIVFFGVLLLYHIVQYVRFRNARFTNVQEVKLEHTSCSSFWRYVAFDIEVVKDGETCSVTTKRVFWPNALFGSLSLDRFAGYTYKVGYCEESDDWVVLL